MTAESDPNPIDPAKSSPFPRLTSLEGWVFFLGITVLSISIFFASRANIVADSVDYYALLQQVTPAEEKPIVRNLHFAEQRSPGFSLMALLPYGFLTAVVEPFVATERVTEQESRPHPPPPQTSQATTEVPAPPPPGSEMMLIPAQPLLLKDLPFKDFYIHRENSWFQWKIALALAFTSYVSLFLGIAACAWMLRTRYPVSPGYSLVLLAIFISPVFLWNIIATPLYATLSAYGASCLFALFFINGCEKRKMIDLLVAGAFLGLLALIRLETGLIAATLALLLALRKEWTAVLSLVVGSSWALVVWCIYNFSLFGTPVHLGILRGDINHLVFRTDYIIDSLVHPASGIILWTPILLPGLAGLLLSRSGALRMLGISSLAMIALCLIRVPIMYEQVGGGPIDIGGITVTVPPSPTEIRGLVRSDNNRYLIVLTPFLVLGLRESIGKVRRLWVCRCGKEPENQESLVGGEGFEPS